MKKYLPLSALALLLFVMVCPAQQKKSKMSLQATLSARENALWEAWKSKKSAPFQEALLDDSVLVGDMGVVNKADVVKEIDGGNCDVQSFTLSDFKLTMVDKDAALLTYKGTQQGTCGGTAIPANVMASSLWVKRAGKWYAAFHQETPAGMH